MKKKLKWLLIAVGGAIVGLQIFNLLGGGVSAEVLRVIKGELEQYLEDTAQVTSRDKQTVYVEGSGKVVAVNVDVGDAVKRGNLLTRLEQTDLELQLKDAEARVRAATAQLRSSAQRNDNQIGLAQAAVDQAQIAYNSAQKDYENAKLLYEAGAMSRDELEKAQAAMQTAAAALRAANLQLADAQQGAPDYLQANYEAQLEQAIVHRDTIIRNMQKQEIRAPIDGVILEKHLEQGMLASPATLAFVLGNVYDLELEAEILADDANKIKIGNKVEISGKAIGAAIIQGEVVEIAPAAVTVTSSLGVKQRRVPVKIAIKDNVSRIKPGYNLDIKIITTVKKDVIKVPDTAVFEYQGKQQVFVVEKGKARLRVVRKGIESGNFVEIQKGLKEGELILTKPDNSIEEGIRIRPVFAQR